MPRDAFVFHSMIGDAPSRAVSFFVHGEKLTREDDIRGLPVEEFASAAK